MTEKSAEPTVRPDRRRRRSTLATLAAAVAMLCIATAATVSVGPVRLLAPIQLAPVVLIAAPPSAAPLRLDGALVRGAPRDWTAGRTRPLSTGEPVPVQLTAYCLTGTTRRDHEVREGIVAADPKHFPLGRYLELYVGREYYGRFLIDDTGSAIRDGILDIWTPSCRDARRFGRRHGTAVLVPRPRGAHKDTVLTGRLGGVPRR